MDYYKLTPPTGPPPVMDYSQPDPNYLWHPGPFPRREDMYRYGGFYPPAHHAGPAEFPPEPLVKLEPLPAVPPAPPLPEKKSKKKKTESAGRRELGARQEEPTDAVRYSNLPYDYSLYRCQDCSYRGTYRRFIKHLKKNHQQSLSQYTVKHGNKIFHAKVLHRCKICSKEITYCNELLYLHMSHNHNINCAEYISKYLQGPAASGDPELPEPLPPEIKPLKEAPGKGEARYSDKPYDYTTYQCQDCEFIGCYKTFSVHLRGKHGLALPAYKARFGERIYLDKVLHICKMCKKEINYSKGFLSTHARTHGMDIEDYIRQYLLGIPAELVQELKNGGKGGGDEANPAEDGDTEPNGGTEKFDIKSSGFTTRYSDKPRDYSTYQCHLCPYTDTQDVKLVGHIKDQHKLSITAYKKQYSEYAFKELVLHVCKICSAEIVYATKSVKTHLAYHNISIVDYNHTYLTAATPKKTKKDKPAEERRKAEEQTEPPKKRGRKRKKEKPEKKAKVAGTEQPVERRKTKRKQTTPIRYLELELSDSDSDYERSPKKKKTAAASPANQQLAQKLTKGDSFSY